MKFFAAYMVIEVADDKDVPLELGDIQGQPFNIDAEFAEQFRIDDLILFPDLDDLNEVDSPKYQPHWIFEKELHIPLSSYTAKVKQRTISGMRLGLIVELQ